MYDFEKIPKSKYFQVLSSVKMRNFDFLKKLCDEYGVIPESACGSCGGFDRNTFWDWFDWAASEKIFNEK